MLRKSVLGAGSELYNGVGSAGVEEILEGGPQHRSVAVAGAGRGP